MNVQAFKHMLEFQLNVAPITIQLDLLLLLEPRKPTIFVSQQQRV